MGTIEDNIDLSVCPVCGAEQLKSGNSLHVWDIEYKCGAKLWGAISKSNEINYDTNCPTTINQPINQPINGRIYPEGLLKHLFSWFI